MRINQFVARASGLSRRASDKLVASGRVTINSQTANLSDQVSSSGDVIQLDGGLLELAKTTTIMLNKPVGYICSRNGQGGQTIYDLLPSKYQDLKPIGRLDKDSSGLLLLTNDGALANKLTHPKYKKEKTYLVELDKPLAASDKASIERGVKLDDGPSRLDLTGGGKNWQVKMSEGKNRQIRRTFAALSYKVVKLHRTSFGSYELGDLRTNNCKIIKTALYR